MAASVDGRLKDAGPGGQRARDGKKPEKALEGRLHNADAPIFCMPIEATEGEIGHQV